MVLVLVLVLVLLVALVGQRRGGDLLWGPNGILEGEQVESRGSGIIGITVLLIAIGVIGATVDFVADIVVLGMLSVCLGIQG